jgi:hypothetical protein
LGIIEIEFKTWDRCDMQHIDYIELGIIEIELETWDRCNMWSVYWAGDNGD